MELKARKFQVNPESPFEGDLLERRQEIENLTLLLRNMNTPMVLAVNGRWGSGKSTFVDMWSKYLELEGFPVLNFNAWTTDFSEDPLVAFLGEMNTGLDSYLTASGVRNEAWERCKKIGGVIARRSLPTVVRLVTAGVLDGNEIGREEAMGLLGGTASEAVEAYESTKSAIDEFKKHLSDTLEVATKDTPLVIFVDELDRCRPTYAIELLERIKHLFDQPGIVFVLSLDKEQLCHSIGAVYGEIDAAGYLRRFIDLEYTLPNPSPETYIGQLISSLGLGFFFEQKNKNSLFKYEKDHFKGTFLWLCGEYGFTLRDIEQYLSRISLALHSTPANKFTFSSLVVFLIVLRQKNPVLYSGLVKEGHTLGDSIDYIHSIAPKKRDAKFYMAVVEGYLIASKSRDELDRDYDVQYKEIIENDNESVENHEYAQTVFEVIRQHRGHGHIVPLNEILKRVELTSQFSFPQREEES
ncbi:hypothetical protein PHACT_03670 [Pseudohongiella acticola]|uniref:KAP NTPase domain-containing protein n=1 Tax=Pseudohongiella acticola TaxID=1524254 RepID=A0A1E8CJ74_9GAMM|nr:P-loop NTPase fold protein [Pseudohongiella acticola]OFE12345.1 hypothetical protein PHACT_03670 [Pseudohongiella acticola]